MCQKLLDTSEIESESEQFFHCHLKFLFVSLFLVMLGLCYCVGFTLVVESGGYSLTVVLGFPIAETSLVKHGL